MAEWLDLFCGELTRRFGEPPDPAAVRAGCGWVEEIHARAAALLEPASLREMPPEEAYARLKAIRLPGCRLSLVKLGKANEAPQVVESLVRLLETPGDLREKFRAAKIPQAGVVTVTQLLCAAKPHRFIVRNTALTRAVARVAPFYTRRALDEMRYEEFLDLCRALAGALEGRLAPAGLGEWARRHRFLLLYAVLTEGR